MNAASARNILDPSSISEEIKRLKQWGLWRWELSEDSAEPRKRPYQCSGYPASTTNPRHWSSFEYALEVGSRPRYCDGLAFAFFPDDPYCGIDLDGVWRSDADEGASWANGIMERFRDTYMEESPSATGIKIWCRTRAPRCGKWPVGSGAKASGAIEIYDRGRYFAVTGRSTGVRVITDHQRDIELLIENLDNDRSNAPARFAGEIQQGKRHPALVSFAGTMVRRGMCPEAIEVALTAVNRVQCQGKYSPEHIRQIVRDSETWAQ